MSEQAKTNFNNKDVIPSSEDMNCKENIVYKNCKWGHVSSKMWKNAFVTIFDGLMRFYSSEAEYNFNPYSYYKEIRLDERFRASEIAKKNVSISDSEIVEYFQFYLEIDSGFVSPSSMMKIASVDPLAADKIARCVDFYTSNVLFQ